MKDILGRELTSGDVVVASLCRGGMKLIRVEEVRDEPGYPHYGEVVVAETVQRSTNFNDYYREDNPGYYSIHTPVKRIFKGPFYKIEKGQDGYEEASKKVERTSVFHQRRHN